MTREFFAEQIARLRTEWQGSYGRERMEILYGTFAEVQPEVFRSAVTELLAEHKGGPPLRREIETAVERARLAAKKQEWDRGPIGAQRESNGWEPMSPRVKQLIEQTKSRLALPPEQRERDAEKRRQELKSQLRVLSPQERAAGEKLEDE